jgi:hypothetical protein
LYAFHLDYRSDSLLQGDIIGGVQLFGAIKPSAVTLLVPSAGSATANAWQVQGPPPKGHAMVLSHSCEVDRANGVKVTSIILAPLRDVDKATKKEKVKELIESNFIDQANPAGSYLKYFYVEPGPSVPFASGAVVDFSKCFSVHNTAYEQILGLKVGQLTDGARLSMSLKLALYFHREQVAA